MSKLTRGFASDRYLAQRRALLEARAQGMRAAPTESEALLWSALVNGKLGVPFRRQVVVGRFVCDFVYAAAQLVVEVDGGYHSTRRAADVRRDRGLGRAGYRVLRVSAELVVRDLAGALARVREALPPRAG